MAVGDEGAVPEKKGGIPLWVIIAGGAALALFLYMRNRSASTSAGGTSQPVVPGVVTDPNTGLPIDPLTGLPTYMGGSSQQPQTLSDWATKAEQALGAAGTGISPALASQAVYDYTNGQSLSQAEANAINKALGLVGFPPVTLPWFGPQPTKPPPTTSQVYATTNKISGGTRQFTPVTGKSLSDLLLKSGLIKQSGGGFMTTPKFGGPVRAFNPNAPVGDITNTLVKEHIILPLNVQANHV